MRAKHPLTNNKSLGEVDTSQHAELRIAALDERHEAGRRQPRLHASRARGTKLTRMACERPPLGLVVFAHIDHKRWLRRFVDEVIGRHLRFPRFAFRSVPSKT